MAKNAVFLPVVALLLLPGFSAAAEAPKRPGASQPTSQGSSTQPGAMTRPMADLVVTEIKWDNIRIEESAKPKTCYDYYYGFTIKNQGNAPSTGTRVIEEWGRTGGGYNYFGEGGLGPLAPGESYTRTPQPVTEQRWCVGDARVKVRITVDPPDGSHPKGTVYESDETNNVREREFLQPITAAPLPLKK